MAEDRTSDPGDKPEDQPESIPAGHRRQRMTTAPQTRKGRSRHAASEKSKPKRRTPAKPTRDGASPGRLFPRESLSRAIRIAEAIREKNAGNPWPPADVAASIGMSAKSAAFFYAAAASRDYGLTDGGRDSREIALTELGRSVVYPQSAREVTESKVAAFRNIKVFSDVLDYYKGNNLPELQYVRNTLKRNFHIDESLHDDFVRVFRENCEYIGLKEGQSIADFGAVERRKAVDHSSGHTVTVADDPGTGLTCFVAMPFSERDPKRPPKFFAEVLARLITVACQAAGFRVVTADRRGSDMIHATIVNSLLDADLVVADLTDHNPNVLFELGMRMSADKPIALIQAEGTPRIFDVDNVLRAYSYNPNLWASTLEKDCPNLTEHIKGAWEGRDKAMTYMKLLRRELSKVQE